MAYVWICLGSALGGGCRHWISGVVARRFGDSFSTGTVIVNVTGCFLIGILAAVSQPGGRFLIHPAARQFLMLGVLGGYTTFSSFSLQTFSLMQKGEWLYAGANVFVSVFLCLIAVWLGHSVGNVFGLRS